MRIIGPDGEEQEVEEDDPGEVPTAFVTKGKGWSGRDQQDDDEDS